MSIVHSVLAFCSHAGARRAASSGGSSSRCTSTLSMHTSLQCLCSCQSQANRHYMLIRMRYVPAEQAERDRELIFEVKERLWH